MHLRLGFLAFICTALAVFGCGIDARHFKIVQPAKAACTIISTTGVLMPVNCSASYTGPGDIGFSAQGYWSCSFAYSASYASGAGKMCNVRRTTDSHTCDILSATNGTPGNTANCSTGGDNGSAASSFCGANCVVVTAYDQSGALFCSGSTSCDLTQATTAQQVALLFSGCNIGSICLQGTRANDTWLAKTSNVFTQAQPYTFLGTISIADTTYSALACTQVFGPSICLQANNAASNLQVIDFSAFSSSITPSLNTPYAVIGVWNGSTSSIKVNGTVTTGSTSGDPVQTNLYWMGDGFTGGTDSLQGQSTEMIFYSTGLSSTNQTALCNNQKSRYSLSGTC